MIISTIGNLKDKASNGVVFLVLSCSVIITGLLYVMQKSEALAGNLTYDHGVYSTIEE